MEKLRKRENISLKGGFHEVPGQQWYVHSPIYDIHSGGVTATKCAVTSRLVT